MNTLPSDAAQDPRNLGRSLIPAANYQANLVKRDQSYLPGLDTPEAGSDFANMLRQYQHMLLKRKWLILSLALVFFVLGGIRAAMKTPLYSSTARIQIDREAGKVIEGGATSPSEEGGTEFLRTQYELLKSRALAERVVSALRIYENAEFFKPFEASGLGLLASSKKNQGTSSAELQARAVGIVMSNVTVAPVMQSRLVDLTYLDPSPVRAQQIANAYAEAYVASTLDKRFEANSYAKTFLEDQIRLLQIRLRESENALLQFAERERMVQVTEKSSIGENNLAAANTALGQIVSERIKNEQLWKQVDKAPAMGLPQIYRTASSTRCAASTRRLRPSIRRNLRTSSPATRRWFKSSTR